MKKSTLRKDGTQEFPVLLSIDKAAKISGLGRNNLAYLIKHCKLPVVKLPGYNRIKIHFNDLMEFIENNKCVFSNPLEKNPLNSNTFPKNATQNQNTRQ